MLSTHALRVFFNERLSAAVEEIFGAVEKTITEYQEEVSRSNYEVDRLQRMLENVLKQDTTLHKADPQQITVAEEDIGPEQQESCPSQEVQELLEIKEELEEVECQPDCEDDSLSGLEASLDFVVLSPTCVKSDHDDEVLRQFSEQQHFNQTQEDETSDAGLSQSPSASSDYTATQNQHGGRVSGESISDSKTMRGQRLNFTQLGVKPYACYDESRKVFPNKSKLQIHVRTHTGGRPYGYHLNHHTRTHASEEPYTGHEYSKNFSHNDALEANTKSHGGGDENRAQLGEYADGELTTDLTEPYSCPDCNRVFKHKANLQIHIRTHTGEKPYVCVLCGKGFTQLGNMNIHMRIHTGDRPYQCHLCGHKCVHSGNLKKHMRTHTKEKPYKCHDCGKEFGYSNTLKDHMKIHD